MQMKPVAQLKQLPELTILKDIDQIQMYLQENDWTYSMLESLKHKDEKVSLSLLKESNGLEIQCKGVTKFSFELLMDDLEIRKLSVKEKEEGIKLRVGPIKIIAHSIKVIIRI